MRGLLLRGERSVGAVVNDSPVDCQSRDVTEPPEGMVERSEIEQHSIKKFDEIDFDLVGACIARLSKSAEKNSGRWSPLQIIL